MLITVAEFERRIDWGHFSLFANFVIRISAGSWTIAAAFPSYTPAPTPSTSMRV
jgi:hypothetical protein